MTLPPKTFSTLFVCELSNYGSCYQIINHCRQSKSVEVFEVSPCPMGGLLILGSSDITEMKGLQEWAQFHLKSSLLQSIVIQDLQSEVLSAYLSQSRATVSEEIAFYETNHLTEAFQLANQLVLNKCQLIDFRVIRSVHTRCVLVADKNINSSFLTAHIQNCSAQVKSYFSFPDL